ncbi:hypothetical protein K525DRAFT_266977 [Schizophyllum commune Loenen D]|nr:hypothetical protein K525DRAFT_266977 [Schizophyllum commune Loenen D]
MNQTLRPTTRRQQPAMKSQPPTSSSASTEIARGLALELQPDPDWPRVDRNWVSRVAEERIQHAKGLEHSLTRLRPVERQRYVMLLKGRIHLPNITGLTGAVKSPGNNNPTDANDEKSDSFHKETDDEKEFGQVKERKKVLYLRATALAISH